ITQPGDAAKTVDVSAATDTAPPLDAAAPDAIAPDILEGDTFVDVPVIIDPDQPLVDAVTPTDAGPLPNLIPVISNPQIQERTFLAGSCEVTEGCTVAGNRRLLRFDLSTPNIGLGDMY